jgi:hypothetical protein
MSIIIPKRVGIKFPKANWLRQDFKDADKQAIKMQP